MRLAVFGGSFDPPHVAHVGAVQLALDSGEVDHVLVVPVFAHAFAKGLTPFDDRVAMVQACFKHEPRVTVSRIEARLQQPNYTVATLTELQREHPNATLRLLVGADILGETDRWHAFERVVELAPLLTVGRQGIPSAGAPPAVLPDVSSSQIRQWIAQDSNAEDLVRLLPAGARQHISTRGLYGLRPGGAVDNAIRRRP